jgi:hypothetical protein
MISLIFVFLFGLQREGGLAALEASKEIQRDRAVIILDEKKDIFSRRDHLIWDEKRDNSKYFNRAAKQSNYIF